MARRARILGTLCAVAVLLPLSACEGSHASPTWAQGTSARRDHAVTHRAANPAATRSPSPGEVRSSPPTSDPSSVPIASPPPAVCAAEALSLRVARARSTGQRNAFGDPDGFVTDFAVTNHSAGTCRLQGWPTMVLRGNSSLRACVPGLPHDRCGPNDRKDRIDRPGPARMGSDPPVVLIKPGGHTSFSVAWRGVICLEPPYRATVRLPGTTSDLGVRFRYDVAPCLFDANDGRETVHITPLGILAHPS